MPGKGVLVPEIVFRAVRKLVLALSRGCPTIGARPEAASVFLAPLLGSASLKSSPHGDEKTSSCCSGRSTATRSSAGVALLAGGVRVPLAKFARGVACPPLAGPAVPLAVAQAALALPPFPFGLGFDNGTSALSVSSAALATFFQRSPGRPLGYLWPGPWLGPSARAAKDSSLTTLPSD